MTDDNDDGAAMFITYVELLTFTITFVDDLSEVSDILYGDVLECENRTDVDNQMFWRRNTVRAGFAFIEGVVSFFKSTATDHAPVLGEVLSNDELALLSGKSEPFVDNFGNVSYGRPSFPKFLNDVRFSFKMFAKSMKLPTVLQVGENGWNELKSAVAIRHRVTHPKDMLALVITEEEMRATNAALQWFDEQVAIFIDGLTDRCSQTADAILQDIPDRSTWTANDVSTIARLLETMSNKLEGVTERQRGGIWSGSEIGKALQHMLSQSLGPLPESTS